MFLFPDTKNKNLDNRSRSDKIFIIGDKYKKSHKDDITFSALSKLPDIKPLSYHHLLYGSNPSSKPIATNVPVFLCFPYSLWGEMVKGENRLCGGAEFGKSIKSLAEHLTNILDKRFPNALYVNHPMSIIIARDKLETKRRLAEKGVNVVPNLEKTGDSVREELDSGNNVYIKVRYSLMGEIQKIRDLIGLNN